MNLARNEILLLFDVDGTLTYPRTIVESDFKEFLYREIQPKATIGIVGGSDLEKMFEQLNGHEILDKFDFIFPENGLVQIEHGKEVGKQSIQRHLGEEILQKFINFVLRYLSDLILPIKRGTFIEFRNGMLNVCPIGRQCTREERNAFEKYDAEHRIREQMITVLRQEFHNIDLQYSIGGQISFDVFPHGWDKTYSLRHITQLNPNGEYIGNNGHNFKEIHFFGDKVDPGGNDYEIFIDSRTISHRVVTPKDTERILREMFSIS